MKSAISPGYFLRLAALYLGVATLAGSLFALAVMAYARPEIFAGAIMGVVTGYLVRALAPQAKRIRPAIDAMISPGFSGRPSARA